MQAEFSNLPDNMDSPGGTWIILPHSCIKMNEKPSLIVAYYALRKVHYENKHHIAGVHHR